MSFSTDGRFLICDGPGCKERAGAPVGSGYSGPLTVRPRGVGAAGWLFVTTNHAYQHFCPRCKERYLDQMSAEKDQ